MLKGEPGWDNYSFLNNVATIAMAILALGALLGVGEQVGSSTNSSASQISLPNCPDKCGDVTIPYPFGIGDNCHYNHPEDGQFYNIHCNSSKIPYYGDIVVENINLDGEIRVRYDIAYACHDSISEKTRSSGIHVTRFAVSTSKNMIGAIGCDTYAVFSGTWMNDNKEFLTGCVTGCTNLSDVGTTCSGIGCCEVSMPKGVTNITINASSLNSHKKVQNFNPCSIAFVVARDHVQNDELPFSLQPLQSILTKNVTYFMNSSSNLVYPRVYKWSIGTKKCQDAISDKKHYLCKGNSECQDVPKLWGYRCWCLPGFQGNPYLNDCEDVDECAGVNDCKEPASCVNTLGSYYCTCPRGYRGNGTQTDPCIPEMIFKIVGGVCSSVIACLIIAFYMHWRQGKRKLKKLRESFFYKNGGHILQQKLSGRDVSVGNTVEMFTIKELKKATNDFSQNSIIGKGGFGMVYKGNLTRTVTKALPKNQLLPPFHFIGYVCNLFMREKWSKRNQQSEIDGVVAIKKSLKVDSNQVEQFINEIIALSQINNKNVVKLLGCCLETEMPLLVYEFISNGTLSEHLHDERKAQFLTWDIRLRIATEVSEVLAYLHTTISIPIIHRDMKSANILLDESYTAKVADFGASKLAPIDQERLATTVQGTWGYLDPEYMQTGELTEKSDVYSFGVVLVELLTRNRAISHFRLEDDRCLAIYFLRKLNDDRLFEILDSNLLNGSEIMEQQLKKVSHIAKKCLEVKGEGRPTMKEVARDLDGIKSEISPHPWLNNEDLGLKDEFGNLLAETPVINRDCGNANNQTSTM